MNEPVIEWNAHIFSPDVQRYPFHVQAVYQPDVSKQPKDPLATYLQHLDKEGIDLAVIVQPEPYGDDHSLVLDCLKREPKRLMGTSLFYPRDPEAPRKLAALVKQEPRIVSTRFHAHRGNEAYLDTFADPGVRALWKQAVDLGLIVELHIGPTMPNRLEKPSKPSLAARCSLITWRNRIWAQEWSSPMCSTWQNSRTFT